MQIMHLLPTTNIDFMAQSKSYILHLSNNVNQLSLGGYCYMGFLDIVSLRYNLGIAYVNISMMEGSIAQCGYRQSLF
jgi:hypothetical protein